MARWRALLGLAVGTLALAALLLVGVVAFLDRAPRGQRFALEQVLDMLEGSLDAEISIQGIRFDRLSDGGTFYGLAVSEPGGRAFLQADSVEIGYAWRTFLRGDVVLSRVSLRGWKLTLSRYPGEEELNVSRIFRSDPLPSEGAAPPRRIAFHDVRLEDGTVELLQPIDSTRSTNERVLTTSVPGENAPLRRVIVESVQARASDVFVSGPDQEGTDVRLDSLSLVGHVYRDPFPLRQLEGRIAWVDGVVTVDAEELSLRDTRSSGRIVADLAHEEGRGWVVDLHLEATRYALEDFRWLLPELPDGVGGGSFDVRLTDFGEVRFGFQEASFATDGGQVSGSGTIARDGGTGETTFQDVRLGTSRLALRTLEPFLQEPLPLEGEIEGQVLLAGTLARLAVEGAVTLREPGLQASRAEFAGMVDLTTSGLSVTNLIADLDPLDYRLLTSVVPESRLGGVGRATVGASGSLSGGLRFTAEVAHEPNDLPASHVMAEGSVRRTGEDLTLDVQADVSPLSLTSLASFYPDLPFRGEVLGALRAVGPLSDLVVTTDLETRAGRLPLEGRFDAGDPGASYQIGGELAEFDISRIVPGLPEPTVFTGRVALAGQGLVPETALVRATLSARDSRIGELDVDSVRAVVRMREGVFHVDTLEGRAGGVDLSAEGTLALREDGPAGQVRVAFTSDSLGRLRPLFMGRDLVARDTLVSSELRRAEALASGIDPDTLPSLAELRMGGRAQGEVILRGALEDLSAEGSATLERVTYATHSTRGAQVTFAASWRPEASSRVQAHVVADSLVLAGKVFSEADLEIELARPAGRLALTLTRDVREDYQARAAFELDSLGGRLDLEELALRFDTVRWNLQSPSRIDWNAQGLHVQDVALARLGGEGLSVSASGTLPREGEADFSLTLERLHLEQVAKLLQSEEMELRGEVDLTLRVRGTAASLLVDGALAGKALRYQGYGLDQLEGNIEYAERRLAVELHAHEDEIEVLHMSGTLPVDLALKEVPDRFPDEVIDLNVVVESLPVAWLTGLLPDFEEVEGTVAGEFDIGGTLENPSPQGRLTLQNAGWVVPALGVRHSNIVGALTLSPDGTMEVDATGQGDGTSTVRGTVRLDPLSDPVLDLTIMFSNFRAVSRRDISANVSGAIRVTGTYQRPFVEGLATTGEGVRVEASNLFVEELVRAASVVDLSDPRYADLRDSSEETGPILEGSPNPFLQNLRVNVDLTVQQNSWLRSSEMDVEIGGDLKITYDRLAQNLVLIGELRAIRGDYTVLGRRFRVSEGTVAFIGIPGVNPNLGITAETRVRRPDAEDLTVVATVSGTLVEPRVELGSDETGVGQSDLVSYVLFNRPSFELASAERAVVTGALEAGVGTVAGRLSGVVARLSGLDYFAITQGASLEQEFLSSFRQTQFEIGQYVSDDVFLVLVLQPLLEGGEALNRFGLRLEWTPTEAYTLQAFFEDRLLRNRTQGFQEAGLPETQKMFGLFVFKEWGY